MTKPAIAREDLAPVLDGHRGNEALRAAFGGAREGSAFLCVLARYVQFNSAFGPGLANLAGEIAARPGLFRDEAEPVRILSDRAAEVGSDFFFAAIDEFDDRATTWRDTHRTLAQATVKGTGAFFGHAPEQLDGLLRINPATEEAMRRVWHGYGIGERLEEPRLFSAMGFHVGSEILADREFLIIDQVLKAQRPDLVAHLSATKIEIGGAEARRLLLDPHPHRGGGGAFRRRAARGQQRAPVLRGGPRPGGSEGMDPGRVRRLRPCAGRVHGRPRRGMISRLGLLISRVFRKTAPDPFVLAILLTLLTAVLALTFGRMPAADGRSRLLALFDLWRGSGGLWKLLDFAMQMCLILVSGHALASSPPAARAIAALSARPQSTRQAAVLVCAVTCLTAVLNWGLSLILGRAPRARGRPLAVAPGPARALPPSRRRRLHGPARLARRLLGLGHPHHDEPGGGGEGAPARLRREARRSRRAPHRDDVLRAERIRHGGARRGPARADGASRPPRRAGPRAYRTLPSRDAAAGSAEADEPPETIPDRLDRSWVLAYLLGVPLLLALARHVSVQGLAALDLKAIIAGMIGLGLLLHRSPRSYLRAVEEGVRACGGIILQFPLYGGIMAMMEGSGLVPQLAGALTALGPPASVPISSFLAGCVINMFVPSGGGHWAVQGPVALEAGFQAGIPPGKMILSVAYGGEATDMLQPFWALPLLAITGVRARDIVGYTAIAMVFARRLDAARACCFSEAIPATRRPRHRLHYAFDASGGASSGGIG